MGGGWGTLCGGEVVLGVKTSAASCYVSFF